MSQEWKLPNTRFHKIMNLFSLLLLLGMFLYTAIKWPSLPQTIATHFNFMGEADGWGGKGNIWLMPVMSLLLYLLLTATTYFPGIWNVPGPVTAYNKNWIYRNVKNLLVFSKFVILLNFSYINYCNIQEKCMGWLSTVCFLGLLFGSVIYFFIRCKQVPPLNEEPEEFDGF